MELKPYYCRIINNIYKAEDFINIMINVENLEWIFEQEKYQKRRMLKNGVKTPNKLL